MARYHVLLRFFSRAVYAIRSANAAMNSVPFGDVHLIAVEERRDRKLDQVAL